MYRLILMLVIACILSGCATENFGQSAKLAGKDNAIVVTDDTGYQVKLKKKPEKIMTNNIYLDNILLGLVEPEKMLSVSKNMDNSAKSFGNMVSSLVENKITNPGLEVINLGTGVGYSVLDMVKAFGKACGKEIPYEIKPRRAGDIAMCYADPAKAAKVLGWKAEKGLDEMCADTWRWQSQNPNGYEA